MLLLNSFICLGQITNYATPFVKNYTKTEYKASDQNFDIVQSKEGEMYFANNYGVLEFNGEEWSLIAQPTNKTALHSFHINTDGVVYVGAENEFGYIKNSLNGQKYYVSLLDKISSEYHNCGAIREIFQTKSGTFFIGAKQIFNYSKDTITIISHKNKIVSSSKVSDSILIQDDLNNIYVVKDNYLKRVLDDVAVGHIRKIFTDKDGELFFYTLKKGFVHLYNNKLTSYNKELNKYLLENEALCFKQLRGGHVAIGTALNGVIIVDENKNPIQILNKANGLQSNRILSLGTDNIGNLWVASVLGIDYIEIASPFYNIHGPENIEGSVYTIHEKNEEMYVGTNANLFFTEWKTANNSVYPTLKLNFSRSTTGQVWKINQIDDYLYVSANNGLFKIDDEKKLEQISEIVTGSWIVKPLIKSDGIYVQGGYEGINILKKHDDGLHFVNKLKGFNETSRVIEIDDNNTIWVAHGYKGVFKLELNEALDSAVNVDFYNWDKGFPSNLFINLYKIDNEILFGTEYGVFQYVSEQDTMVVHPLFKKIFVTNEQIRLLKEIDDGILFIRGTDMDEKIGIIEMHEDGLFSVTETPFQKLKGAFVPGFDNVTQTKSGNLLFGTKEGLIFYNKRSDRNYNKPYNTNITRIISIANDSLVYGDYDGDDTTNVGINSPIISLPYNLQSLEFNFAAAFFESNEETMYSFFLEGYDSKWSMWKHRTQKQYTGLKNGKYVFHVKSKNVYKVESTIDSIAFEILPPWYKTTKAYVIYTSIALIFIMLIVLLTKRTIKREKTRIIAKENVKKNSEINNHLQDKLLIEKKLRQISERRNEKDIEDKNDQLASSTLHLMQMNNTITQIKNELENVILNLDSNKRSIFKKLIASIDEKAQKNESWKNFELHFNKVHNDFLQRIRIEFPELSNRDIRLCAYLRLNLSSKEIAQLMGISFRGVESLRYRVRKKLAINPNENLTEYLLSF